MSLYSTETEEVPAPEAPPVVEERQAVEIVAKNIGCPAFLLPAVLHHAGWEPGLLVTPTELQHAIDEVANITIR